MDNTQAPIDPSPRVEDRHEAPGEGAPEHEAGQNNEEPPQQQEEQEQEQEQGVRTRRQQTENEVSEVEIPNVGRIMVRADADGYNEEVSGRICCDAT